MTNNIEEYTELAKMKKGLAELFEKQAQEAAQEAANAAHTMQLLLECKAQLEADNKSDAGVSGGAGAYVRSRHGNVSGCVHTK